MKKRIYCALAVLVLLVGSAGMALAAQNVGNPSQKGSFLVWPKVVVERDVNQLVTADTVITLVNDYFGLVDVKCYWMDQEQNIQDFVFRLTRSQPVWFRASDGAGMAGNEAVFVPPFEDAYGELKCWAVNVQGDAQINHNHLFGSATIYDYQAGTAWEYSSWNFIARVGENGKPARGAKIGTPGEIRLTGLNDGKSYDACPQYVLGTFMAADSDFEDQDGNIVDLSTTDLTVVPCRQDLRQDRTPTITKLQFDIWNEDEVKSTGAYMCIKCWIETPLRGDPVRTDLNPDGATFGYINHRNFDKFTIRSLHTTMGFFRVTGVKSTVCSYKDSNAVVHPSVNSPVIGVISKRVVLTPLGVTADNKFASSGTQLNTAGTFPYSTTPGNVNYPPVTVLWDIQDPHPEVNPR